MHEGHDVVRGRALLIDSEIAAEPHHHQRVATVGKDATERRAHRAGGVEGEELDEHGVVE